VYAGGKAGEGRGRCLRCGSGAEAIIVLDPAAQEYAFDDDEDHIGNQD
jgi:hypothetical protein